MPQSGVDGEERQSLPIPLLPLLLLELLLELLLLLPLLLQLLILLTVVVAVAEVDLQLIVRSLLPLHDDRVGDADGEEVHVDGHELDKQDDIFWRDLSLGMSSHLSLLLVSLLFHVIQ